MSRSKGWGKIEGMRGQLTKRIGLKSGLLATVEPEWLKKVQTCSLNDTDFGPLLKLGMKECKALTVSERISLKQYTIAE